MDDKIKAMVELLRAERAQMSKEFVETGNVAPLSASFDCTVEGVDAVNARMAVAMVRASDNCTLEEALMHIFSYGVVLLAREAQVIIAGAVKEGIVPKDKTDMTIPQPRNYN